MDPNDRSLPRLTAEDIFTPWEMEGHSRRDSKPHRGPLLTALAYVSLLVGGASFLCLPIGLVGLPLTLTVWRIACRDLDLMRIGDMDRGGFHPTEKARADARAGVILCLLACVLWFPVIIMMFTAL